MWTQSAMSIFHHCQIEWESKHKHVEATISDMNIFYSMINQSINECCLEENNEDVLQNAILEKP